MGAGFAPGSFVDINATDPGALTNPDFLASPQADGQGNVKVSVFPPLFKTFDTNQQTFGLAAVDSANPPNTAVTTFKQVRFGFTTSPTRARPDQTVKYTVRGFAPGKVVYAHFRFAGKTIRDVKIGKATAPCGQVSRRMRLIPANPHAGVWGVYMDQVPKFDRFTNPQASGRLTVSLSFR